MSCKPTSWEKNREKESKKNIARYKPRVLLNVAMETLESMNVNEYEPIDIESVYFVFW